jgi:hypothetical protein
MIKLIDTIEKHTIVRYGGEDTEASSLLPENEEIK